MKKIIPVFLIMIVLVSCSTVNPFTDSRPVISFLGENGTYLFTTTKDILSIDKIRISRLTACFNPLDNNLKGTVEGDFSKLVFNTAMKINESTSKVKTGRLNCWYDSDNSLFYYCPADGLVLFAKADIEGLYSELFEEPAFFADSDSVSKMISSESGFYVSKPETVPDIGLNIQKNAIERFETICATLNGEVCNIDFELTSEDFAESFLKLMKAAVIAMIKQRGETPDLSVLKRNIMAQGNTVSLKELEVTYDTQKALLAEFL